MKKSERKGPEGFEQFYHKMHGQRWHSLKQALHSEGKKIHLWNPFRAQPAPVDKVLTAPAYEALYFSEASEAFDSSTRQEGDLFEFYRLDLASLLPPLALEAQPGERILDMCSAPGGKALAILFSVKGAVDLVVNDASLQRVKRLKATMRDYLPEEVRSRVLVTHHDATRWGLYEKEAYDRILLDAPCSGEEHLLETPKELKVWSPSRTKKLAIRQYALLCAALDAVKPGGRIVYSTCSVSIHENDEVIKKLLKKRKNQVEVLPVSGSLESVAKLERSEHGYYIWPDHAQGWGPIYFSILEKQAEEG